MVKWDFWTGLNTNDTWSLAYEWKQKFGEHEMTSYIILGVILVICLGLIWWKRKGFK